MKSILDNHAALQSEVLKIAEVAGYLWQNGWAERNGGNITVNVTDLVDDAIRALPAISDPIQIGVTRILPDCASYVIIADEPVMPTSELPSHLTVHASLIEQGSPYRATVHTHPIELVAMSHSKKFLGKDVLTHILWSMIPETKAFCPLGLGIVPYQLPGSKALADATLKELEDYDVVMWEKHGVFAKGLDVMDAFDQIDVLSKAAKIYINARAMGFEPDGMSDASPTA